MFFNLSLFFLSEMDFTAFCNITPNSAPPPGTQTPVKGTVKLVQVRRTGAKNFELFRAPSQSEPARVKFEPPRQIRARPSQIRPTFSYPSLPVSAWPTLSNLSPPVSIRPILLNLNPPESNPSSPELNPHVPSQIQPRVTFINELRYGTHISKPTA